MASMLFKIAKGVPTTTETDENKNARTPPVPLKIDDYKLTYFNFRGAAEPIRWILKLKNVKFEDVRLSKYESWFGELKNQYPWGVLPVLCVNGTEMSQSTVIARYLARKFSLTGRDEWDAAVCDELVDSMIDLRKEWIRFWREMDLSIKADLKIEFLQMHVPKYFSKFSELIVKNGEWLVTNEVTWADLFVVHFLDFFQDTVDANLLESYPILLEFKKRVFDIPQIKDWVDSRPKTFL